MVKQDRKLSLRIAALIVGILIITAISVGSMIAPPQHLVMLLDDGELILVQTTDSTTVNRFLQQNNIDLDENDRINYSLNSRLTDNMIINIYRAISVTVIAAGETQEHLTTYRTPVEILSDLGFDVS